MNKILIPFLAILLSGCASLASMPPKVSEVAYKEMTRAKRAKNKQKELDNESSRINGKSRDKSNWKSNNKSNCRQISVTKR